MDQIILNRTPSGWTATYRGVHRASIVDLFGTDTLPTAYSAAMQEDDVYTALVNRNPGVLITRPSSLRAPGPIEQMVRAGGPNGGVA